MAVEEGNERSEDGDRDSQQHAEGERPALVLRRHDEEDDKERQAENDGGRHALRRLLLLVRHAAVVEAHLRGHGFVEDVLQRGHGLTGTVTRRGVGIDLHAVKQVVAHDELSAGARVGPGQGAQGDHLVGRIPDVELAEVFRLGAEVAVGLDVYLPLQTKAVVMVPCSSGRLRASAIKIWVFLARKSIPEPDRSSRMKVAPPDVPTPGIAGGGKENAMPYGNCDKAFWRCALMPS